MSLQHTIILVLLLTFNSIRNLQLVAGDEWVVHGAAPFSRAKGF